MTNLRRLLGLALVLAAPACAKGAKEAAPAQGTGNPEAQPASPTTATQSPGEGGSGDPGRDQAIEEARKQAILGPSADTHSFDPIPDGPVIPQLDKGAFKHKGTGGSQPVEAPKVAAPSNGTRGSADYHAQIGVVALADSKAEISTDLVRSVKVRGTEVQACYDNALEKSPHLVGMLRIAFTVAPSGALTAAKVATSTVKNIALESCVIAAIEAVKLPKPLAATDTAATVTITFAKAKT